MTFNAMENTLNEIKKHTGCDIRWDPFTRNIYSVDASIYEVEPLAVAAPRNVDELTKILQLAAMHNIPVTARGAATGITGSCLGKGIILDLSMHLNKILKIDFDQEYAIVEPGVVQDRLNDALSPYGYRLGPDTSTGNRATIGGMVANNSAGARSLFYGRMCDHLLEVQLALAGGTTIRCGPLSEKDVMQKKQILTQEGVVYKETTRILEEHANEIHDRFPKIPRHVSGYNLDLLLNSRPFNLCHLICGSEGTLGITTEIKMRIAKKPKYTGVCLIPLDHMLKGMEAIELMLAYSPMALEMIDGKILNTAAGAPSTKGKMDWLHHIPEALFVAEFQGNSPTELEDHLNHFLKEIKSFGIGRNLSLLTDQKQIGYIWEVRKAGLGLLLSKRSYSRAIAFIEDVSVAPQKLAAFMEKFLKYLTSIGKEAGVYGHVGSGCMHIRPYIDLQNKDDVAGMQQILDVVSSLILEHGGAMSGEHGDGLVRSWLNEKMFGKTLYQAFRAVKQSFDPQGLMNPGKIVDAPFLLQDLRTTPNKEQDKFETFLDFSKEGGIVLAADMCNGNGQCRKKEGIMCPTFQASDDEYLSTRARAQSLRAIFNGKFSREAFMGKALYDVLDLCIECKGCKRECPSQVDMAKMKSEFLYHYQEKHGYSLRQKLFGNLHHLLKAGAPFASLLNRAATSSLVKTAAGWVGISPERPLPQLSLETFSKWFAKTRHPLGPKKVILFSDTYTEFIQPEIGIAAYRLLDHLGYEISLFSGYCCGRPLISKGMLKQAKKNAERITKALQKAAQDRTEIIVLEPSCLSAFRDDFLSLLGHDFTPGLIWSLEEFLQKDITMRSFPTPSINHKRDFYIHGHCHQKALVGMDPTLQVLKAIPGSCVNEIISGCCGMAGSFGYEKEHDALSMKIGEQRLFPAIRNAPSDACIIASGFSCRAQIQHGTGKRAYHLAEAILAATDWSGS